jgi:hypothetical protein
MRYHRHSDLTKPECYIWHNEHIICISNIVQKYESQNCMNSKACFFIASLYTYINRNFSGCKLFRLIKNDSHFKDHFSAHLHDL